MSCRSKTVGIVVGHHPEAKGATLEVGGFSIQEYDLWAPFAEELALTVKGHSADLSAKTIYRPNPSPDDRLGRRITQANVDAALELHFNGFSDPGASGTLMIYRENHGLSREFAKTLQARTRETLGLRDRGTVGRSDLGIMRHTRKDLPLALAEPAFGTNPEDGFTLLSSLPSLMRAYRQAIVSFARSL